MLTKPEFSCVRFVLTHSYLVISSIHPIKIYQGKGLSQPIISMRLVWSWSYIVGKGKSNSSGIALAGRGRERGLTVAICEIRSRHACVDGVHSHHA
jgi:hypothetical protein